MFEGEMASLTAILKTNTVKVPKPFKVLDGPGGGSLLVMEHLDMRGLSRYVLAPAPLRGFVFPLRGSFTLEACMLGYSFEAWGKGNPQPHMLRSARTLQAKGTRERKL